MGTHIITAWSPVNNLYQNFLKTRDHVLNLCTYTTCLFGLLITYKRNKLHNYIYCSMMTFGNSPVLTRAHFYHPDGKNTPCTRYVGRGLNLKIFVKYWNIHDENQESCWYTRRIHELIQSMKSMQNVRVDIFHICCIIYIAIQSITFYRSTILFALSFVSFNYNSILLFTDFR